MIKLSIVTINYNDKVGLKKTIESVINQTYKGFEFIVIDGNSSDGSKEVLNNYKGKINYSISEPDNGVYHAMNKGIKKATGDFILFLNSGDFFYNNNVLKNAENLISNSYDIYYGNVIVKKPNSEKQKTYPNELTFSYFYTNALCHQSCFIKRQLFYDHFFYNENYKIYSDGEFFMYTICLKNIPYKHLDLIVSVYDFTGISSTKEYEEIHYNERMESINKFFPTFNKDYEVLSELNSKRTIQFLHIKKFPLAWKTLKFLMNILLLFIPKQKT